MFINVLAHAGLVLYKQLKNVFNIVFSWISFYYVHRMLLFTLASDLVATTAVFIASLLAFVGSRHIWSILAMIDHQINNLIS